MPGSIYQQIRSAFRELNPDEVRRAAERPLSVGLVASSPGSYAAIEDALMPGQVSRRRRFELVNVLHRADEPGSPDRYDLVLCQDDLLCPPGAFSFNPADPGRAVRDILDAREELALPLARNFFPFRKPVTDRIIWNAAKENALFTLASGAPGFVAALIQLPWAVSDFASDSAFLTMNQVRMAFLLAAASDQDVGYYEQRMQIAAIVGGALAWRSLARGATEKIRFSGGLVQKAAVAFAGTFTVGTGLERFYWIGYGLTRAERREIYGFALERGRALIGALTADRNLNQSGPVFR